MKTKLETTYKIALALLVCPLPATLHAVTLKVGDKAPDFTLKTLDDQTVRLNDLTATSKVVLVVNPEGKNPDP
jgi:hypothetical protein